jgi:hypothetical protein
MESASTKDREHPELGRSDVIKRLPEICADDTAAVEFFERQRRGD